VLYYNPCVKQPYVRRAAKIKEIGG